MSYSSSAHTTDNNRRALSLERKQAKTVSRRRLASSLKAPVSIGARIVLLKNAEAKMAITVDGTVEEETALGVGVALEPNLFEGGGVASF